MCGGMGQTVCMALEVFWIIIGRSSYQMRPLKL
jgi:hypothetical protein